MVCIVFLYYFGYLLLFWCSLSGLVYLEFASFGLCWYLDYFGYFVKFDCVLYFGYFSFYFVVCWVWLLARYACCVFYGLKQGVWGWYKTVFGHLSVICGLFVGFELILSGCGSV